ncbi:MAG TPA: glycosyltransferase family A protein [Tepidisphaeraceae bacterium]|jgi:glycosyltransferase involved in cell wall biosynthesis|nr:glycosyltransferase family A protein [Tepidisphaeraceae bacterium]
MSPVFNVSQAKIMPAISVVIPVYNGQEYIAKAVDSALAQTRPAAEIVILDDASTDGTSEILKRYADRREIRFLKLEQRIPAAAAWNAVIRSSSAPFFLVLAHDDEIDPPFLESAERELLQNPDADLVVFSYRVIDRLGQLLGETLVTRDFESPGPIEKQAFLNRFSRGQFFLPSFVVTRRTSFDDLGGLDVRLKVAYDWDFYLRAGLGSRIVLSDKILGSYRTHETQSINAHKTRDNGDNDIIFSKLPELDGRLSEWQLAEIVRRMCDFVRRFATSGILNSKTSSTELVEMRRSIEKKLRDWKNSSSPVARFVTMEPSMWRQKIVWNCMRRQWTIAPLRPIARLLGYKPIKD